MLCTDMTSAKGMRMQWKGRWKNFSHWATGGVMCTHNVFCKRYSSLSEEGKFLTHLIAN